MKRFIVSCAMFAVALCSYAQWTAEDLHLKGRVKSISSTLYKLFDDVDGYTESYYCWDGRYYPFCASVLYELDNKEDMSYEFDIYGNIIYVSKIDSFRQIVDRKYVYKEGKLDRIMTGNYAAMWLKYDSEGNITDYYRKIPYASHYKYVTENDTTKIYEVRPHELYEVACIKDGKFSIKLSGIYFEMSGSAEPMRRNVYKDEFEYYKADNGLFVEDINDLPFITYIENTDNHKIKDIWSISSMSRDKSPWYRGTIEYDESGSIIRFTNENSGESYTYKYEYDSKGNWTACTIYSVIGVPLYVIRRQITYFGGL